MKRSWYFILIGFTFGILFWMINVLLNYFFLYKMDLFGANVSHISNRQIYIHMTAFVLFVVCGILLVRVYNRRLSRKELFTHSNEIWSQTFDSLGDAVSIHAEDYTILNANQAMCEMLGKTRKEMIGKKCYELFHHTNHPIDACPCQITRKSRKRETSEFRESSLNKWLEVATTPIVNEKGDMFAYVHLVMDVTEERKHEGALYEKLDIYELIVQHAAEAIAIVQDEQFVFVTRPMETITGYSNEELVTKPFVDFIHPEDRTLFCDRHKQHLEKGGSSSAYHFRVIRKGGEERWLEISPSLIEWKGQPAVLAVLEDVTERMKNQVKLQESMTKYAQLLATMSSGAIVYDVIHNGEEYLVKEINDAAERIENVSRGDIAGTNVRTAFPYVVDSGLMDVYKEVWKTGRPRQRSREIISPDGAKRWRVHYVQRLQTGEIADVFEDVAERRRTERTRDETESHYRAVVDNANEAIFIAQDGVFKITNPKVGELTGYTPEELASKDFAALIHPDDQAMVIEHYEGRLKGEMPPAEAPFRMIDKTGRVRWVQINAVRITWDGKPATLNFLIDVTERQRAEEELRESEERFRSLNEASFEGVIIHEDGVITDINSPGIKLLGYEWIEAKGARLIDIVAPTSRHVIAEIVQGAFDVHHEIELVRGDGSRVLVEVRGKEMPYMGRTVGVIAMRDVSERKKAEGEIRKRMEEIERLNDYLIGREMRIIEVKKEVNNLLGEIGRTARYKV